MEDSITNSKRRKYSKSVSVDTTHTSSSSSNLEQPWSKKFIKQAEKGSFNSKKNYSYKEKLSILKKLDLVPENTVIDEYKISDRTLRRWKKERVKIEEMCNKENTQERKKIKLSNEALDEAVYLWFCQCRSNGVPVSGPMIKQKALDLNKQLGGDESFKASEGWLDKPVKKIF
ncbi:tigger transposable element-derived protein 5-like [Cotesia glomerata]|uniref:tigger transposable element-derived protein 5-like n=1 Tax=Cotesia glomerata TaxID=32391 RepID=UPI001D00844B|nr:tigger transposable element-derived protein 5-like [Cotesia glomerata]